MCRARTAALPGLALAVALASACVGAQPVVGGAPQPVAGDYVPDPAGLRVETWAEGLDVPWGIAFLPDGGALVTERPGTIRLVGPGGEVRPEPYATLDVRPGGEGGLMGIALHPSFPDEPYVYAMHTADAGGRAANRVVRLRHEGDRAAFDRVVLDGIPAARFHNGGRIAFGPDGMLYVTTGDATEPGLAQDLGSLAGKILRLTPEGEVPPDNPFPGSPVWSYGHRNPQGLAWRPGTGELFATEHGPTGEFGLRAHDEVNRIVKGGNYGWPLVVGAPEGEVPVENHVGPLVVWPDASVPPAGAVFHGGDLYVATLASEALVRIRLEDGPDGPRVAGIERLFATGPREGRFGRLRAAVVGPDGALYVSTSNRGGRGAASPDDDRILRIVAGG